MQKQTSQFVVVKENGIIKQIGKSTILQPKVDYKGSGTKWYEDTYSEIQTKLHMTQKEYTDAVDVIRSYETIKFLL